MTTRNVPNRLSTLALALALSCGTVGGLLTVAAFTEPAVAQSAGGNGGGAGGAGGGELGNPMNAAPPRSHARTPNDPPRQPPQRARSQLRDTCEGQRDTDIVQCKYTPRAAPRVIRITGFAGCSAIQQVPGTQGRATEFECVR